MVPAYNGDLEMLCPSPLTVLSGLGLLVFGLGWWCIPAPQQKCSAPRCSRARAFADRRYRRFCWHRLDAGVGSHQRSASVGGWIISRVVVPGRGLALYHGGAWTPDEIVGMCHHPVGPDHRIGYTNNVVTRCFADRWLSKQTESIRDADQQSQSLVRRDRHQHAAPGGAQSG